MSAASIDVADDGKIANRIKDGWLTDQIVGHKRYLMSADVDTSQVAKFEDPNYALLVGALSVLVARGATAASLWSISFDV